MHTLFNTGVPRIISRMATKKGFWPYKNIFLILKENERHRSVRTQAVDTANMYGVIQIHYLRESTASYRLQRTGEVYFLLNAHRLSIQIFDTKFYPYSNLG